MKMKMKRLSVAMLTLAMTGIMSAVTQAAPVTQQAGAYASWLDSEDLDQGYGAGMKYSVMWRELVPSMPGLMLGLDARIGWLTFDGEDNDFGVDVDVCPVELTFLAKHEIAEWNHAAPYVGAGVGGYFFDVEDDDALDMDDEVGFHVVAGWEQPVTDRVSLFAEARYLWLEPDIETSASDDELEVGGFGANVGVCIAW
jgi:opacity protein-like surface antigen